MRFLKNLFLYFSAFIPLFVLLVVKLLIDIFNQNLSWNFLNTLNLALLCTMITFGTLGILWNTIWSGEKVVKIFVKKSEEITDMYFLQYFSLFVLFAVPLDISYFNEFFVYIIILVFIGIVYINCSLFYINPLLNILGFRFYNTTFVNENGETKTAKIFSRTKIYKNESYNVKIKNEHFAFISNKKDDANIENIVK